MLDKQFLISMPVSKGSYEEFKGAIVDLAESRRSSFVCIANVHMVVEAFQSHSFAECVNNAAVITPDGMPIAKAMNSLYGIKQDRVAGMDLLPDLLSICEKKQLGVFFYGGSQQMLDRAKQYFSINYPGLIISGLYSPPFRPLTVQEEQETVKMINKSNAAVVFVVLGCPKQEKWMCSMKGRTNTVMIGVGGALPVLIGMQKRAPEWMQHNSLEWLWRLLQEPRRLFKRYLITNSIFLWLWSKLFVKKIIEGSL
jgi:N-acetylglucosaminyldiphosphoundecaprenol N-acetyl-beta-D-mannosaminyltransferase